MSSTNIETNGGTHDHLLRPRPRKPQPSQGSEFARQPSNSSIDGLLDAPHEEASALTRYADSATTAPSPDRDSF